MLDEAQGALAPGKGATLIPLQFGELDVQVRQAIRGGGVGKVVRLEQMGPDFSNAN